MPEMTLAEISSVISGKIVGGDGAISFSHYHFDSRQIGDDPTLFFAIKTEKSDGHHYIHQLPRDKQIGAVVRHDFKLKNIHFPVIKVDDPLAAVHKLAVYVRQQYRRMKFIGITGSAGKTTTKEFTFQILARKYRSFRSFENWNNWIGLPFSLLNMEGNNEMAVFELAMSYPGIGEIDLLAEILKPDLAVILNVFPVHLEFLKNIENVAKAKAEILNYLSADDMALVTGDSPFIIEQVSIKKGRLLFFGRQPGVNQILLKETAREDHLTRLSINFFGLETEFVAPVVNQVHVENLFAAITICQCMGMKNFEIQEALAQVKCLPNRGRIQNFNDFTIIDETYNSNPEALRKTLSWIDKEYDKGKIAVIGDMLELGEEEEKYHQDMGQFFCFLHFDRLITVGSRAKSLAEGAVKGGFNPEKITSFSSAQEAGIYLRQILSKGCVIVFKASRGIGLEAAIKELTGE